MFITFLPDNLARVELHCDTDGHPYLIVNDFLQGPIRLECLASDPQKLWWIGVLITKRWDSIKIKALEKRAIEEAIQIWTVPTGVSNGKTS